MRYWSKFLVVLAAALLAPALVFAGAGKGVSDEAFIRYCATATAEQIQSAIKRGANPNAKDKDGWTALMNAARHNTAQSIRALLKAGADVNAQNKKGLSALMVAARFNTPSSIRALLLAGADVNARMKKEGFTPLLFAVLVDKPDNVRTLLDAGADVNAKDSAGFTALIMAAYDSSPAVSRPPVAQCGGGGQCAA